jgi:hypothetical protein
MEPVPGKRFYLVVILNGVGTHHPLSWLGEDAMGNHCLPYS